MGELSSDLHQSARLVLTLRRAGVTANKVLQAMEDNPRSWFVDPEYHSLASEDAALPIACGQTCLRPSLTGMLLQMADIRDDIQSVLLVGAGSGYTAALLSQMLKRVFAVERYKSLVKTASEAFKTREIEGIELLRGDGLLGWDANAPYDRIIVTGLVEEKLTSLLLQLAHGGCLIQPVKGDSGQKIQVLDKSGNQLNSLDVTGFSALTPGTSLEL